MNLDSLLCGLWKPLRTLLKSQVQFAASTAKRLSKVALTLLKDLAKAVGEITGVSSTSVIWIALGCVCAYFLLKGKGDNAPEAGGSHRDNDDFGGAYGSSN